MFNPIKLITLALACGVVLLASSVAFPQAPGAASKQADGGFAVQVAEAGAKEVEAGRIAAQRGNSTQVKQFGQRMVDEHAKADAELRALATKKGMMLPAMSALHTKHQASLTAMSKLSGAEFDRAFMNEMVKDHQAAVALFERESKSGPDAEWQAFATKTLPTLRAHLANAQSLQSSVTGAASR